MRFPIALIPAYKPDPSVLSNLVKRLVVHFHVVVVDDGSGEAYAPIFVDLAGMDGVSVLRHHINLGKGAALRTGLNHIAVYFPESVGAVTLDADGQHLPEDVMRVAEILLKHPQALVLGCRSFGLADSSANTVEPTPLRSRLGNVFTRNVLRLMTGLTVSDTQTGLRGIPRDFIPETLLLRTSGYDFELDMLLLTRSNPREVMEVPIQTIYIDGNASSHFNPLLDSLKIYIVLLRFSISSMLTAILDFVVFSLCMLVDDGLVGSIALARLTAGVFNFSVNRRLVFKSSVSPYVALCKYAGCVLFMGVLSYALIQIILSAFNINVFAAKLLAESVLYLLSFLLQREFVFKNLA